MFIYKDQNLIFKWFSIYVFSHNTSNINLTNVQWQYTQAGTFAGFRDVHDEMPL